MVGEGVEIGPSACAMGEERAVLAKSAARMPQRIFGVHNKGSSF